MQTVPAFPQQMVKSFTAFFSHKITLILTIAVSALICVSPETVTAAEKTNDPNIIYILADDKN